MTNLPVINRCYRDKLVDLVGKGKQKMKVLYKQYSFCLHLKGLINLFNGVFLQLLGVNHKNSYSPNDLDQHW